MATAEDRGSKIVFVSVVVESRSNTRAVPHRFEPQTSRELHSKSTEKRNVQRTAQPYPASPIRYMETGRMELEQVFFDDVVGTDPYKRKSEDVGRMQH